MAPCCGGPAWPTPPLPWRTAPAPRPQAFVCPADSETTAVRAVRNVSYFRLHYAIVLWVLLLATLAPSHHASMLFLMAASKVALFYGVLLRAFPNSTLLRRILDRRLVLSLFLIVIVVELVLTDAIPNSTLLRRILDRRLVLSLFLIVIIVELALTDAIKQLLLALAIGVPLVLLPPCRHRKEKGHHPTRARNVSYSLHVGTGFPSKALSIPLHRHRFVLLRSFSPFPSLEGPHHRHWLKLRAHWARELLGLGLGLV